MSVRAKTAEPVGDDSVLPPGQRDGSGFWLPQGCDDPRDLVRRRGRRVGGAPRKDTTEQDESAVS